MKILVDKLPESPEDCLFSRKDFLGNGKEICVCTLHPYIPQACPNGKPNCICKSVYSCELLKEM